MAYNFGTGATSAAKGAVAGSEFEPWGSAIGGALGALGGFTGKSGSSRKMYEQAALQHYYWQQQMKTAHQLEAEDLKAAGFNPALTTNSGTAGNGIGSNKIAPSEGKKTPITDQLNGLFEAMQENKVNNAQVARTEAETNMIKLQSIAQMITNKNLPERLRIQMGEALSRTANNYAQSAEAKSRTTLNTIDIENMDPKIFTEKIQDFYKLAKEKGWNSEETMQAGIALLGQFVMGGRN